MHLLCVTDLLRYFYLRFCKLCVSIFPLISLGELVTQYDRNADRNYRMAQGMRVFICRVPYFHKKFHKIRLEMLAVPVPSILG